MKKLKVLELFSGTESISKAFRQAGHSTYTVDNNPDFKPDMCIDILDFDIKMLPKEWRKPEVIWASPPCQKFSVLTIYRYWENGKPRSWKTYKHLAIVKKTVELIEEINPEYWFIENPVGMLRKQRFMQKLPRKTVTYCQYGFKYRKPTDIWTNASAWVTKRICKIGDACHMGVKRGERKGIQGIDIALISNWDGSGTIERGKIPPLLCKEIVKVCEGKNEIKQTLLNLK